VHACSCICEAICHCLLCVIRPYRDISKASQIEMKSSKFFKKLMIIIRRVCGNFALVVFHSADHTK